MAKEARWYQSGAVDALFDFFEVHGGTTAEGLPVQANPVVALPTGTGKALAIALFLKRAFGIYPGTRAMMLTHVKELVQQNAEELLEEWPNAPLGIYSAGLNRKDLMLPIIFGGVGSVVGSIELFGFIDFLIVDECHLIGTEEEAEYLAIISALRLVNPYLKVIGFTATPYRMGLGLLTEGPIFTHICYDQTGLEAFNRLIDEGYICPLLPRPTETTFDLTGVGMYQGDYAKGKLEKAVNKEKVTRALLAETCYFGADRYKWLIFASGVDHSESIARMLTEEFGISCLAVHSKLSNKERDRRIAAFKRGEVRAMVGNNIFTTGFNDPTVDLIVVARPSRSTVLWVQLLGRGTRIFNWFKLSPQKQLELSAFEGMIKRNCLVLDFARNTAELGPINDPRIPSRKGAGSGEAPVKICPTDEIDAQGRRGCGGYNHTVTRFCDHCGFEFSFESTIVKTAGTEELIRGIEPVYEVFAVQRVIYSSHIAKKFRDQAQRGEPVPIKIKASYFCEGMRTFFEYVTVEGGGFPAKKGRDWFRQRFPSDPPETNAEVLNCVAQFRPPRRVKVHINTQYPEVVSYEF